MPDRRTLALVDPENARVLLVNSGHPHPALSHAAALASGVDRRITSIAVSPDGQWLAAGGWKEHGVDVWNLRQRRLQRVLRPDDAVGDTSFFARFSPDGRWLVSMSGSAAKQTYHFWRAGTWELDHRIDQEGLGSADEPPAFTSDGGLMALGIAADQVALANAATGEELARLTTLQPRRPAPLAFSPDGTKLVARTNQNTMLVWDLGLIRDQLAPLRLDWDAPQYPPPDISPSTAAATRSKRSVRIVGKVIETQARRAAELAEMNRRLKANPDDAAARLHRGWLYNVQNKWSDAIADLKRLPRGGPEEIDISWLLGDAYWESGRLFAALLVFDRMVQLLPQDQEARFHRGLLLLALNQHARACEDFTRILTADPDLDRARYRRARALFSLGRYQDALADLAIVMCKLSKSAGPYELRGAIHQALGELEQAHADRERASSLVPRDSPGLNNWAWTLATGPITELDPEGAVALARRAVALASGEQVCLNTLGVALYRSGQYTEAVSALERSLAAGKGASDGLNLFFLAMAHQTLGRAEQARKCFDQAVRWSAEHNDLPALYTNELSRFRVEASEVLGIPAAELPTEVFAGE
jgi:tetratricopeptide (TPR) repeat protein